MATDTTSSAAALWIDRKGFDPTSGGSNWKVKWFQGTPLIPGESSKSIDLTRASMEQGLPRPSGRHRTAVSWHSTTICRALRFRQHCYSPVWAPELCWPQKSQIWWIQTVRCPRVCKSVTWYSPSFYGTHKDPVILLCKHFCARGSEHLSDVEQGNGHGNAVKFHKNAQLFISSYYWYNKRTLWRADHDSRLYGLLLIGGAFAICRTLGENTKVATCVMMQLLQLAVCLLFVAPCNSFPTSELATGVTRTNAHLYFHYGPLILNVQVLPIYWNPHVYYQEGLNAFYCAVPNSAYFDWLTE